MSPLPKRAPGQDKLSSVHHSYSFPGHATPGLALLSAGLELNLLAIAKNISIATWLLTQSFVRKRWPLHRADQPTARQAVPPLRFMNRCAEVLRQITLIRWGAFRGGRVLVIQVSFHLFVYVFLLAALSRPLL